MSVYTTERENVVTKKLEVVQGSTILQYLKEKSEPVSEDQYKLKLKFCALRRERSIPGSLNKSGRYVFS